jgi:hypothetical protein
VKPRGPAIPALETFKVMLVPSLSTRIVWTTSTT